MPTGCMGNEIAVKVHTLPGQEIVTEERGHILNYELGAAAVISGVTIRPVKSGDGSGAPDVERDRAGVKDRPALLPVGNRAYLSREHA